MIHVIDKASIGNIHVLYNASILRVLRIAFPNQDIIFYGESVHVEFVKNKANLSDVKFVSVNVISTVNSRTKGISRIHRLVIKIREDRSFFKQIFKKSENNKDDIIFLCSAATFSFYIFKKLKTKYKVQVIATLHGELEYVFNANNKSEKFIGKIYKKIFSIKTTNFIYLLLNKISKEKLLQYNYLQDNEIIDIDHPYIFSTNTSTFRPNHNNTLQIGHVGLLSVRKSSELIYDLANLLKPEINNNIVSIHSIGPIEHDIISYRKNNLVNDGFNPHSTDFGTYLAREEFEQQVKSLKYALFFYNSNQYIFRASGAIFDVITFGKPVIALRHPYFEYLFTHAGNIGFLCDTLNDMRDLILKITNPESVEAKEYSNQIHNIEMYKHKISIENIALDLQQQFLKLNY